MADYVFFPLSHILRRKDEWPERVLELTLKCLRVLLETAWSNHLVPQMFEQFCLMLVLITEGKGKQTSEDVKEVCVACLVALFKSGKESMKEDPVLTEAIRGAKLRPLLGHAATVLLDVVKMEALFKLRLEAIEALELLYVDLLADGKTIAAFLPLTVSTISRCLSSSRTANHKLIISLLNVLRATLSLVMTDSLTPSSRPANIGEMYHVEMTESWYRATKGQIKIALESFFPFVRGHAHARVREAVIGLSEELISLCPKNLDLCQSLFLETILSLQHDNHPSVKEKAAKALRRLHAEESLARPIRESIEESLHSWTLTLPRTMSSNDDQAKVNLLHRISSSVDFFAQDTTIVSPSLEALLATIQNIAAFNQEANSKRLISPSQSLQLTFQAGDTATNGLSLKFSNDEAVSQSLEQLLQALGRTILAPHLVDKLVLEASSQSPRSALDAWIALQILRGSQSLTEQVDELYGLASDWLIQSDSSYSAAEIPSSTIMISLEIITFTASTRKDAFREDLINILYPTLSLISHSSASIQSAARQTLERIAKETGFNDTQTLILENTDYLVNSVALRLNVFDVSVQILATLYTVTKLAGPRIVPYMDDIWSSLFNVVDRFHGYEKLVTGVFAVMTGMVDVLTQSVSFPEPPQAKPVEDANHIEVCRDIQDLIYTILKNEDHLPRAHREVASSKPPPLPPKTALLLQNVARKSVLLSTHPSPNLRFNLVHLLRKSLPLLSIPTATKDGEQDPFLPLLAQEIWPAICTKLADKETWIVNAAFETIADLFMIEGDFLGPKVEKDVWPVLKGMLSPPKRGKATKEVTRFEKDAAIRAIVAIVTYSDQKPGVFDEMLEVCWAWINVGGEKGTQLRNAFEKKNADAVWLLAQRSG
jgi:TELO2-interacting protein 1